MRADQYSPQDAVKVKARANYQCEFCGSDQMVQAHAPNGDHSDWRGGVCLCAQHHWEQHPDVPRSLFFTEMQQPYWPNVTARALAVEFNHHSRTIIRAAKKLGIPRSAPLSPLDKKRIRLLVVRPSPPVRLHPPREPYQVVKEKICPECGSRRVWFVGLGPPVKSGEGRHRVLCRDCGRHFCQVW